MSNNEPNASAATPLSEKEKADRKDAAVILTTIAEALRAGKPVATVLAVCIEGECMSICDVTGDDMTDSAAFAVAKVTLRRFKHNAKKARSCA